MNMRYLVSQLFGTVRATRPGRGSTAALALVLLVAGLLLALAPAQRSVGAQRPLRVIATFSIVGDLVGNVGGGAVDSRTLVGPNGDTHTYEPAPSDAAALADADLIVENGLRLETWLDDLYVSSRSRAVRVALADGLELLPMGEAEEPAGGDAHGHGHAHGDQDPHVWQDVDRVARMVENLRDALSLVDPANAATYRVNADRYLAELRALDGWVFQQVGRVPPERRKLVTTHETFNYFARRYGFEVIGAALPLTTDTADPSARETAELVDRIRAAGVPVIFADNVSNPRLMEQIAAAAGVRLAPPLYTDALDEPGTPGETYLQMMRHNVTIIVDALTQ
jgi:zinc/manganese transport system substrate-binding protein